MIRFGSVCSGIEAASIAFAPLGWRAAWLAEIEPFPCAVLAHHYPDVPNLGDMTTIARRVLTGEVSAPDVLCGGTPCQAFSVAGLRQSLADERGNLSLKFVELADAIDHVRVGRGEDECIVFWENVPGVLSTRDNAFGCFLAGLTGEDEPLQPPGDKWANAGAVYGPARAVAWRTLDAQYFGLAQRRRRVFVVASARKGFDPAQVLFEWDGLRRDTAPSREARQTAPTIPARSSAGGGLGTDFDCDGGTICVATGQAGAEIGADMAPMLNCNHEAPYVAHSLRGEGFDASEDGTGRGTPLIPVAVDTYNATVTGQIAATLSTGCATTTGSGPTVMVPAIAFPANLSGTQCASAEDLSPALGALNPTAVAFSSKDCGADATADLAPTMRAMGHDGSHANGGGQLAVAYTTKLHNTTSNQAGKVYEEYSTSLDRSSPPPALLTAMQVRRLTPTEAERLMGFPDGYTAIPWRGKPPEQCPDGPRYKALGNSWAVPVAAWIGARIDAAVRRLS